MRKSKLFKRVLSVVLSFVLVFTCVGHFAFATDSIDELKDKISEYQRKIDEAQASIDELDGNISKIQDYMQELDSQIQAYQDQIDVYQDQIDAYEAKIDEHEAEKDKLQKKIDALNDKIAAFNKQIDELNDTIETKYEELREIIRTNYISGETSSLEVLLCSDDFSDYLTKAQYVSSMADYQQSVIDDINDDIKEINTTIGKIDEQKAEIAKIQVEIDKKIAEIKELEKSVDDNKKKVEANQQVIVEKQNQNENYLAKLRAESEEFQSVITEYKAAIEESNAQISQILAERAAERNQEGYEPAFEVSSGFICPLPIAGRYISDGYYYRTNPVTGEEEHHGGIDISGPSCYGQPILACASGEVVIAEYHYSWGNYVLIDHGNGLSTLYAHMSGFNVGVGQVVSQGDVIGYVGMTGYTTGPHLHVEVWVDGSRTDPSGYVPV